jgi:F0F1-type ATP synthase membrane subunit c/vacuolar-type H+-ATPase subunit K
MYDINIMFFSTFSVVALSIALVVMTSVQATAKNPDASSAIRVNMLLGIIFLEFICLLTFAFGMIKFI